MFVQIGIENVHIVRNLMDEIFDSGNAVSIITFQKTGFKRTSQFQNVADYILWYSKNKEYKFHKLYLPKVLGDLSNPANRYDQVELSDGSRRPQTKEEKANPRLLPENSRPYQLIDVTSQGGGTEQLNYRFQGKEYMCPANRSWNIEKLDKLVAANRLISTGTRLMFIKYLDEFPVFEITNIWSDCAITPDMVYVVQTNPSVIQRCMLMTTDPGDLVLDITCGSGTTAYVAEQWGRRWITCDTSRVAIALAKKRLMTSTYDYYQLAYKDVGVSGGFRYGSVPNLSLDSIARGETSRVTLYDQPEVDKNKIRVSGPFTVEALPAPVVKPLDETYEMPEDYTAKQADWRDELLATGILGRGGAKIEFSRVEPLSGTIYLQAEAETIEDKPRRAVICFAGENKPMDSRMVALALTEAEDLRPSPKLIIFAAFQFDPEAAKDIDSTKWAGVTCLKVQMNTDLMTEDLKKKRSSNQSFWLVGQPDVELIQIEKGKDKGKYQVRVNGFDYYDVKKGTVESGNAGRIAMWMLDTNYDGMSIEPMQVFFPLGGKNEGWSRLAKTLRAEINQDLIEQYAGTVSLPFAIEGGTMVAVKIIDDRGIESLKVLKVGG